MDDTNLFAPAPNTFDTEVNGSFTSNTMDTQTGIVGSIIGGATATVVDIGASLWNSLPGTPEVETEEILGRWSGDALKVYQDHPDAIQAVSLIGGAILPGLGATKTMTAMRNGSKAVNWFTAAGKEADLARVGELFARGGQATTEYKTLTRGIYAKGLANQVLDAAAAEVAIAGLYNAHPMMEDYLENPAKNFALGILFGGVVGGAVGNIAERATISKLTGAISEEATNIARSAIRPTPAGMPDATALQTMGASIDNLGNIMKGRRDAGFTPIDDLIYGRAAKYQSDLQADQMRLWDNMLDDNLKTLTIDEKKALMKEVVDGQGFWGVERLRQVSAKDLLNDGKISNYLADAPTLSQVSKKGIESGKKAVYYPEEGRFGTSADLPHHAGMAALGHTDESLLRLVPDRASLVPNFDAPLELLGKTTAAAEADYAAWTLKLGKMDDDAFEIYLSKALLSHNDAPQMQAVINRLEQSPAIKLRGKVKIADTTPHSQAILNEVDAGRTAGGTPIKYQAAVEGAFNNNTIAQYSPLKSLGAQKPGSLAGHILEWVAGDTGDMQLGATAYFARGWAAKSMMRGPDADRLKVLAKKFGAWYESPESVLARKKLMEFADKDGKIYLFRGVNAPKVFGSAPLESMAITTDKAAQFAKGTHAKTLLYKVDVDDVVGMLKDTGPHGDNVEVVVRASAREAEATLSPNGRIAFRKQLEASLAPSQAAKEATFGDLQEMLAGAKFAAVTDMIRKGFPPEVVSKRANLELDTLRQFMAGPLDIDTFESLAANAHKFKSVDDVAAANSVLNRPLEVTGNLKKADYTKAHAQLSAKNLNDINDLVVSNALAASASPAAQGLGDLLMVRYKQAIDIAMAQLGRVNNQLSGMRSINSFDFYTRNMGDVGITVSGLSKGIQKLTNDTIKRVLSPITEAMGEVSKDAGALVELNIAKDLNDSLAGYRVFRNGQIWQKVSRADPVTGKMVEVLEAVPYNGVEFKVQTPSVIKLVEEMQRQSKELLAIQEAHRRIIGAPAINDIGLWMPSFNPRDKALAYVHDRSTNVVEVLVARNEQELQDSIKSFKNQMKSNPNLEIIQKSDQAAWSMANGRLDPVGMKVADSSMRKGGSGTAAVPRVTAEVLGELAGGYEHAINAYMRNLADVSMSNMTDSLRKMSKVNQQLVEDQPFSTVKKILRAPEDSAKNVLNTLLGNSDLGAYEGWKSLNQSFEVLLSMGSNTVSAVWKNTVTPLTKGVFGRNRALTPEALRSINYEKLTQDLAAKGILNPFANFDKATALEKFGVASLELAPESSKRIIYGSNALAATMALRFGELAQPLVNIMSWPIITGMASRMASKGGEYMGIAHSGANISGVQVMYEGVRAMNSPLFKHLGKRWEDAGYFTPLVSETSDIMRATRQFDKGPWAKVENALDSKVVEWMSWTADKSEGFVRRTTMYTGAMLAKKLYPGLSDDGVTIFARDFMDKALGNYTASQRPVAFQGTLGVALGLFQTYFLTLAQNTYRHLELKDFAGLGKAALAQSTIFGASSLPGFDVVSKAIGENFSDENIDLTTGTYRAAGPMADAILYGLPSNLGPAFYTRGGVDVRLPNVLGGLQNTVGANFATQTASMMGEVSRAMGQDNASGGRALLQALSLQNMSRPIARGAELASGYSINRAGKTMATPEEVWSTTGIIARVLSTRPLEEAKLRQADHLNSYYEASNRDKRKEVTKQLRTSIRSGELSDELVAKYADGYLEKGGSINGWRAAYKEAIGRTETSGREQLLDKLKPESPVMHMIEHLDGQGTD